MTRSGHATGPAGRWVLYGTGACHLCEEARAMLAQLEVPVRCRDIALDDELSARYGVSIPVLQDTVSGSELRWPFDVQTLRAFTDAEDER